MDVKTCSSCGEAKSLSEFYRNSLGRPGHRGECKPCGVEKAKLCRHANPVAARMRIAKWREANREKWLRLQRESWNRYKATHEADYLESRRQSSKKSRRKRPHVWKARSDLNNAIRSGRIIRKPCEVCGEPNTHGHHDDYSRPLDVRWLCRKHHDEYHSRLKRDSWS